MMKRSIYPHIGLPLKAADEEKISAYVHNPAQVCRHAFLPLVRKANVSRPYSRRHTSGAGRKKVRYLCMVAHQDVPIYNYYAHQLSSMYEQYLAANHLEHTVLAYRTIPVEQGKGGKNNIHFAKDVFDFISGQTSAGKSVAVITFDIKGFFDNLQHAYLKRAWRQLKGENLLEDEYKVFRSITRYCYVEEEPLFQLFKHNIICRHGVEGIATRKVKHLRYMRSRRALAYCKGSDMPLIRRKGLLRINQQPVGLPQGIALCNVLANIYMAGFDKDIAAAIDPSQECYYRYSDDMIIVCPKEKGEYWKRKIADKIQDVFLTVEDRKTQMFYFTPTAHKVVCEHVTISPDNGTIHTDTHKVPEYLGFAYDGNKTLIRSSTICKYYYALYRTTAYLTKKRANSAWYNTATVDTDAQEARIQQYARMAENILIQRFSFPGAAVHLKRDFKHHGKVIPGQYTYGNFMTYVNRASSVMSNNASCIRRQMHSHHRKIHHLAGRLNNYYIFYPLDDILQDAIETVCRLSDKEAGEVIPATLYNKSQEASHTQNADTEE